MPIAPPSAPMGRGTLLAAAPGDATARPGWEGYLLAVGVRRLLVPVANVLEVIALPREVTPVPGTVPWLLGIAHYRGNLLPIFDLAGFVAGCEGEVVAPVEAEPKVLVLPHADLAFGLAVSRLLGTRRCSGALRPPQEVESPVLGRWASGVVTDEGEPLPVVDVDLLASDLQRALAAAEIGYAPR